MNILIEYLFRGFGVWENMVDLYYMWNLIKEKYLFQNKPWNLLLGVLSGCNIWNIFTLSYLYLCFRCIQHH